MPTLADELRDEVRKLKEVTERQRRELGGLSSANRRKEQRIRELEAEVDSLRAQIGGDA